MSPKVCSINHRHFTALDGAIDQLISFLIHIPSHYLHPWFEKSQLTVTYMHQLTLLKTKSPQPHFWSVIQLTKILQLNYCVLYACAYHHSSDMQWLIFLIRCKWSHEKHHSIYLSIQNIPTHPPFVILPNTNLKYWKKFQLIPYNASYDGWLTTQKCTRTHQNTT